MSNDSVEQGVSTPATHVKYFEDQLDDEEVLYVFRKHPIVMRKGLIFGSVGLLVGPLFTLILTYVHADNPPTMNFFYVSIIASFLLSAIIFFPYWLAWFFSIFIMTDKRFIQITQKGFFNRAVSDINLELIQSINYEVAGVEQTLLGYGTILMQTYVGDLTLHHIHNPAKTQRKLATLLRESGVTPQSNPVNLRAEHHDH